LADAPLVTRKLATHHLLQDEQDAIARKLQIATISKGAGKQAAGSLVPSLQR